MASLTLKRARKILGKLAENVSDDDLQKDIATAELLKSLFFSQVLQNGNLSTYTKNNHGNKDNTLKT